MSGWIDSQLSESASLVDWLRKYDQQEHIIDRLSRAMATRLNDGGRILTCGNGGSMCDAMHMAEELSGRFRADRIALAAQAISDPAHLTCVANDFGYDRVFARGIEAWGRAGDVAVLFSTSGNSPNLVRAAEAARNREMIVIGLLGRTGGALRQSCHEAIVVPAQDSGRIQEVHIKIVHLLIEGIERILAPVNYAS
jgi:D-sedoheptulose 7-phosphate isomerase